MQRERSALAIALATIKKFGEDRTGQLAALIAYYGFFSLFPLMLAFVTILGLFLEEVSSLRQQLVDSALAQFPIIGDQIRQNVHSLQGNGVALAIGIGGALWAGLGGIKAAQNAMDQIWDVPVKRQPSFQVAILRAALMLLTLGVFVLLAGFLGGIARRGDRGRAAGAPDPRRRGDRAAERPRVPGGVPRAHPSRTSHGATCGRGRRSRRCSGRSCRCSAATSSDTGSNPPRRRPASSPW